MISLKEIYLTLNEQKYRVYHGSNDRFEKFDVKRGNQKIGWFTDNAEYIRSGESGARGTRYILSFDISLKNPAGWDEYKRYGIGQLKSMGYDGVILPNDDMNNYIVFDNRNIKYVGIDNVE